MATYNVTTSNWNDPTFWSAITAFDGDVLEMSALGAGYSLTFDHANDRLVIGDGVTTFSVGAAGASGEDATLGGGNVYFFRNIIGPDGSDDISTGSQDDTLSGGDGNDSLNAGGGDDAVEGGAGDDTIFGEDGADSIDGGSGNDTIEAGDGNDTIVGGVGDDTLRGGAGRDSLSGGDGDDLLESGVSADTIVGAPGDTLDGGTGNDVLQSGSGNDLLIGGTGHDTLSSGAGDDSLSGGDGNDLIFSAGGADTINAGAGDDSILGQNQSDSIMAGAGNDTVSGGFHDDTIYGGIGDDSLKGDQGDDLLEGEDGADTLEGGSNDDTLIGGAGDDSLEGGSGSDLFTVDHLSGTDTIVGGDEGGDTDTLHFAGSMIGAANITFSGDEAGIYTVGGASSGGTFSEIETFSLTGEGDTVDGTASTTAIFVLGEAGDDSLLGGSGDDTISGGDGSDYIEGGAGDDFLTTGLGDDTLIGGDGNDTLMNSDGDDSLDGGAGDDSIVATGGDDTLRGGTGDDTMEGGDDADTFIIEDGFGNDSIIGGEGGTDEDVIDLSAMTGAVTVSYGDNAEIGTITDGTDTISFDEIEHIITTDYADLLDGSGLFPNFFGDRAGIDVDAGDGDDTILGGHGGDTIQGGDGDDFIDGDYGDDSLGGGGGNDTISGQVGNHTIDGGSGDDEIDAGDQADTLIGGTGDDLLTGGEGDDVFVYTTGDGADTITDFNFGITGSLHDDDTTNNDFIDLGGFYDHISELREDYEDDGILNQSNDGTVDYSDNDSFASGDSLTFQGMSGGSDFTTDNTGVVCFTKGTRIATPQGEVPIERLRCGDMVLTQDSGAQPILWMGHKWLSAETLRNVPHLRHVQLPAGLTGGDRALGVSPQHGVLLNLNGRDHLVRATHLARLGLGGARFVTRAGGIAYFHVLLPSHQIVLANGAPAESFYPGRQAMQILAPKDRQRVLKLLPALRTASVARAYGPRVRPFAKMKDLKALNACAIKPSTLRARGPVQMEVD